MGFCSCTTARSALGAPERGAGSPNGLTEGFHRSVDVQTPPVSLTLNHLPFQGRHGRFAPQVVYCSTIIFALRTHWLTSPFSKHRSSSSAAAWASLPA